MIVKELKEIIKDLPDDTEVEINCIWDENLHDLTPVGCDGFYHKQKQKVFLTPNQISI